MSLCPFSMAGETASGPGAKKADKWVEVLQTLSARLPNRSRRCTGLQTGHLRRPADIAQDRPCPLGDFDLLVVRLEVALLQLVGKAGREQGAAKNTPQSID